MPVTDKICGYTLYKSGEELPFRIVPLNDVGEAKILLETNATLDAQRHPFYRFEIAAHDCIEESIHSPRYVFAVYVASSSQNKWIKVAQ